MEPAAKNKKMTIFALAGIAILTVAILLISNLHSSGSTGKVEVEVDVLPTYASITANDKKISTGKIRLAAGTYKVTAAADGFTTKTEKFEISTDRPYIQLALPAVSSAAQKWENNNSKLYFEYEAKVARASQQSGTAFKKQNPIVRLLPYDALVYKIGYRSSDGENITLTVHGITPEQRRAAVQQIRDWGYDPTDYKIEFIQFKNPLE